MRKTRMSELVKITRKKKENRESEKEKKKKKIWKINKCK